MKPSKYVAAIDLVGGEAAAEAKREIEAALRSSSSLEKAAKKLGVSLRTMYRLRERLENGYG